MDKYNKLCLLLGLPKTFYINFKYLRFKDAIKLPILVSKNVYLKDVKGELLIKSDIKFGMIKIGFSDVGIFDRKKPRTIFQVNGTLIFNGKANIGHGCKISVNKNGKFICGNNFRVTAESQFICSKKIIIGNDCLFSWNNLIMDTDFHHIYNKNNEIINKNEKIIIGNSVWMGCRCTILKGSVIKDNVVIAANSLINKEIDMCNSIIGGNPCRVLRKDIYWKE